MSNFVLWFTLKSLEVGLSLVFLYSCWSFEYPQGVLYELWGYAILALVVAGIIKSWFCYINLKYKKSWKVGWRPINVTNLFLIASASSLTYHLLDALPTKTFFEYSLPLDGLYKFLFYCVVSLILLYPTGEKRRSELSLVIALIFSSPLYSVPMDIDRFATLNFYAIVLMGFLYFLYATFDSKRGGETPLRKNPLFLRLLPPLMLILLIGMAGGLFSVCGYNHLMEFMSFLVYVVIFVLACGVENGKSRILVGGVALFNVIVVLTLCFMKLWIHTLELGSFRSLQYRLWIAQLHPNFTASYLVLFAPLFFAFFVFSKRKIISRIGLFLFLVTAFFLLLTYTKAGWIALILSFLPLLFAKGVKDCLFDLRDSILKRKKRILAFIVLLFIGLVLIPNPVRTRVKTRFANQNEPIGRFVIYKTVLRGLKNNPFWGIGLGNHFYLSKYAFDKTFELELDDARYGFGKMNEIMPKISYDSFLWARRWLNWGQRGSHAHNVFLELAISMGLFFIFAFLWFLAVLAKGFYEIDKRILANKATQKDSALGEDVYKALIIGGAGGLTAVLACSMFDYPFGFISLGSHIALILGLQMGGRDEDCLRENRKEEYGARNRAFRLFISAIFVGVVILLIAFVLGPSFALKLKRNSEVLERFKRYPQVLPYLKYASMFDPLNPAYYVDCGDLSVKIGDYERAKYYYRKSLNHNPYDASVLNKLGLIAWLSGNRGEAAGFFNEALKNDPVGVFDEEHFTSLALAIYDQPEMNPLFFYLLRSAVLYYPLKVNDIFWDLPSNAYRGKIRVVSYDFRSDAGLDEKGSKVKNFLNERLLDVLKGENSASPQTLVINRVDDNILEKDYEPAVYLADLCRDIFNEYLEIKNRDPDSAQHLLIALASIYNLCGLREEKREIMKIGRIEKLPVYDKKGNIIEKIELTQ